MKTIDLPRLDRRMRLLLLLMGTPALLTAFSLGALEAWRVRKPESPLFATPFVYSLADAIERDDVRRAYEFTPATVPAMRSRSVTPFSRAGARFWCRPSSGPLR